MIGVIGGSEAPLGMRTAYFRHSFEVQNTTRTGRLMILDKYVNRISAGPSLCAIVITLLPAEFPGAMNRIDRGQRYEFVHSLGNLRFTLGINSGFFL